MSSLKMFCAALAATFALAAPALAEGIEVHDAYAFSAYEGAPSGAAFMVIHNHGFVDDRLIGATSAAAMRVELHETIAAADGTMQMRALEDGIALPAGDEVTLQRGGMHVMFMGITEPWATGDEINLTLIFEIAGEVAVTVPVDLTRMDAGAAHDGMTHGD